MVTTSLRWILTLILFVLPRSCREAPFTFHQVICALNISHGAVGAMLTAASRDGSKP